MSCPTHSPLWSSFAPQISRDSHQNSRLHTGASVNVVLLTNLFTQSLPAYAPMVLFLPITCISTGRHGPIIHILMFAMLMMSQPPHITINSIIPCEHIHFSLICSVPELSSPKYADSQPSLPRFSPMCKDFGNIVQVGNRRIVYRIIRILEQRSYSIGLEIGWEMPLEEDRLASLVKRRLASLTMILKKHGWV